MHFEYFEAGWCGVCREKSPLVGGIAAAHQLDLQRWDVDDPEGADRAEYRRIRTVPTLALVAGERVPFRLVGAMITAENVRGMMDRVTGTEADDARAG